MAEDYDSISGYREVTSSQDSFLQRRARFAEDEPGDSASTAVDEWHAGGGILMVSAPPTPNDVHHTPPEKVPSDGRRPQCSKDGVLDLACGSSVEPGRSSTGELVSQEAQPSRRLAESLVPEAEREKREWQSDAQKKTTMERKRVPLREVVKALYLNKVKKEEKRRIGSLGFIEIAKHLGLKMDFRDK